MPRSPCTGTRVGKAQGNPFGPLLFYGIPEEVFVQLISPPLSFSNKPKMHWSLWGFICHQVSCSHLEAE